MKLLDILNESGYTEEDRKKEQIIINQALENKEISNNSNPYGDNYYQYRIDCKIKGFAQSKKFIYATCVNEASALAKSDPSIERILAIYRV